MIIQGGRHIKREELEQIGETVETFQRLSQSEIGCVLFLGAARALRSRDQWIGWSTNDRLKNLGLVVNNGRFLIFPWVKVRYLASHALGKVVRGIGRHWQKRWGYRPVLLETFVDAQYFELCN